jgi:hypothetical protein
MFGIFKGEFSAMLNLECTKAETNLPNFRALDFPERIKNGFRKVSEKRTVPSALFGCCQAHEKCSVFSDLKMKNNIFLVWHNFCMKKFC